MSDYYFKIPAINQLSVLETTILYETSPVAITGGDCFSRNIVMLWRHISNSNSGKRSLLLTYTTLLKQYLRCCCESISQIAARNIETCLKNMPQNKWDEILIAEAQDMSNDYYEQIKEFGNVSYSCDDSSILYPEHCSKQFELSRIFPNNVKYVLGKNFISTQRIMQFCRQAFIQANIPMSIIHGLANNVGEKPVLLISNGDFSKQDDVIIQIIKFYYSNTRNIGILVPWNKDVIYYEKLLDSNGFIFSSYYPDIQRFPNGCNTTFCNIHLTTFKCVKGMKFDAVIIPNFHRYKEAMGKYNLNWQDFYVACSCATENLYLISNYVLPELSSITNIEIL